MHALSRHQPTDNSYSTPARDTYHSIRKPSYTDRSSSSSTNSFHLSSTSQTFFNNQPHHHSQVRHQELLQQQENHQPKQSFLYSSQKSRSVSKRSQSVEKQQAQPQNENNFPSSQAPKDIFHFVDSKRREQWNNLMMHTDISELRLPFQVQTQNIQQVQQQQQFQQPQSHHSFQSSYHKPSGGFSSSVSKIPYFRQENIPTPVNNNNNNNYNSYHKEQQHWKSNQNTQPYFSEQKHQSLQSQHHHQHNKQSQSTTKTIDDQASRRELMDRFIQQASAVFSKASSKVAKDEEDEMIEDQIDESLDELVEDIQELELPKLNDMLKLLQKKSHRLHRGEEKNHYHRIHNQLKKKLLKKSQRQNTNKKSDPMSSNQESAKSSSKRNGIVKAYAANTNQGLVRTYNEDRVSIILNIVKPASRAHENWPKCSFFGVYDGHGGVNCADFLRDNLHQFVIKESSFPWNPKEALRNGFAAAEAAFLEIAQSVPDQIDRSGSCAITVLIVGDTCFVANVGDSRAVLSGDAGQKVYTLSRDHKPSDDQEQKRIILGGGKIYQTHATQVKATDNEQKPQTQLIVGPLRVFPGRLSVSRTFGDIEAKVEKFGGNPQVVVSEPEIKSFKITEDHDFIVLASDGVFDKMTSKEVIQSVWSNPAPTEESTDEQMTLHKQCGLGVDSILRDSMNKRSLDNVTVVMIAFSNYKNKMLKNIQVAAAATKAASEVSKQEQQQQSLQQSQQQSSQPTHPLMEVKSNRQVHSQYNNHNHNHNHHNHHHHNHHNNNHHGYHHNSHHNSNNHSHHQNDSQASSKRHESDAHSKLSSSMAQLGNSHFDIRKSAQSFSNAAISQSAFRSSFISGDYDGQQARKKFKENHTGTNENSSSNNNSNGTNTHSYVSENSAPSSTGMYSPPAANGLFSSYNKIKMIEQRMSEISSGKASTSNSSYFDRKTHR